MGRLRCSGSPTRRRALSPPRPTRPSGTSSWTRSARSTRRSTRPLAPSSTRPSRPRREAQLKVIDQRLKYVSETLLKGNDYLTGSNFTVADIYLYIVLSWAGYLKVDLTPYPVITAFS